MHEEQHDDPDPDHGDALVDLTAHRAAAHAFRDREHDVPAVERQQRQAG